MNVQPFSEHAGLLITPSQGEGVNDLDRKELIDLYRSTGALYFQGYNVDVAGFEQVGNKLSSDWMNNAGSGSYRETVAGSSDGTIQNVAYNYGVAKQRLLPLPLHADRSYVKSQPPMIMFMCERPAASGGQTTLCDGVKLFRALSDSARRLFTDRRLKYIRHYPPGEWSVLFHTSDLNKIQEYCWRNELNLISKADGSLTTEHVKSAVQVTRYGAHLALVNSILIQVWQEDDLGRTTTLCRLEDDSKIPAEVLAELKEVSEELTVDLPWQSGDFVIVDNSRMMHGRRPFEDTERMVYVRMCHSVDW